MNISPKINDRRLSFVIMALLVVNALVIGIGIGGSANGASASGTSIPVSKGGTGATTAMGALQHLLPDYANNDGKVLGLNSGVPAWVNQTSGEEMVVPDYSQLVAVGNWPPETATGSKGYTWTADQTGFVAVIGRVDLTATTTGSLVMDIVVNGKMVSQKITNHNPPVGLRLLDSALVPVKTGDVVGVNTYGVSGVTFGYDTQSRAYFIPPLFVQPANPTVVVEEGGDYSTSEQAVMVNDNGTVRQKEWTDGKPIYKRTFTSITAAPSPAVAVGEDISTGVTVDKVINSEFMVELSNGDVFNGNQFTDMDGDTRLLLAARKDHNDGLLKITYRLPTLDTHWHGATIYSTVYYTKP
jgi:hypothetical protein